MYLGRNCLLFAGTWVHTDVWLGSVLLIFLVFCNVLCLPFSYDLRAQCCQCLWIAPSVFCLCPMTCVPNVANVSGLPLLYSVFALWLVCPMLSMSLDCPFCILCLPYDLCAQCCQFSLDCPFCILCLPYDLRAQCCQCLWIAPSVFCVCPMTCVPDVANVSGLPLLYSLTFI